MKEPQRDIESLRQSRVCDESVQRHALNIEIAQLQRHARCAQRAAGLMAVFTALVAAGFGYLTILLENFPSNAPVLLINLIYAVGAGSLISFLTFAGLGMVYRKRLNQREEAYRNLTAHLFETPLNRRVITTLESMLDGN